jgi:hypothetical protein
MYFPGEPLNGKDFLFRDRSEVEQKLMMAVLSGEDTYSWDIVLQKM